MLGCLSRSNDVRHLRKSVVEDHLLDRRCRVLTEETLGRDDAASSPMEVARRVCVGGEVGKHVVAVIVALLEQIPIDVVLRENLGETLPTQLAREEHVVVYLWSALK